MITNLEEKDGVYVFEYGEKTYTYRTKNRRQYTNQEFMNIFKTAFENDLYYNEPCTVWNDLDGYLAAFPRNKNEDYKFMKNVKFILENVKSEEKKQVINNILNKCFIVDEEPKLKDGYSLHSKEITLTETKEFGAYHIDNNELDEYHRDLINFVAHKYGKNKDEKDEMDVLMEDENNYCV